MSEILNRTLVKTADGSTSLYIPGWDERYHSQHGAIAEAQHVFINTGLKHSLTQTDADCLHIMEIGFGTGLNGFLTAVESLTMEKKIAYTGYEAYPISLNEADQMNYGQVIANGRQISVYKKLHQANWEETCTIHDYFSIRKRKQFFHSITDIEEYHLIYFDAFGARVQPEVWEQNIFEIMYKSLKTKGILVTYSAKGSVRRAMQDVGFEVERLPGPPGKREMLRATKIM